MMTPQEIQEKTFAKAVFGGYDMQMVDDFIEPLAQDYITLYKENDVLKSKLKVLVKKLEEYRDEEEKRKQAADEAQKACEQMMKEAEQKCSLMLQDAELEAARRNSDDLVAQEEHRLNCAKELAANFIDVLEKDIQAHLELLASLRDRDLSKDTEALKKALEAENRAKALREAAAQNESSTNHAKKIADEIEQSLSKMGIAPEQEDTKPLETVAAPQPVQQSESPTIRFQELQFGKNYDPVKK